MKRFVEGEDRLQGALLPHCLDDQKPHREKLSYFIPEWDDLVDRDYDFENDVHSGGSGDWSNQVYAHQMYSEPNYDGILISKVVAEKSKKKKERGLKKREL